MLFRDWFVRNELPWDSADFDGLSDHIPFLAEGIVIGGLFSGADDVKTKKQRDRYDTALGQGWGGISDIAQDPCYHKACDSMPQCECVCLPENGTSGSVCARISGSTG